MYESKENFRDIMLENKELFDLSNQPKDSKNYFPDNKKVPGKRRMNIQEELVQNL